MAKLKQEIEKIVDDSMDPFQALDYDESEELIRKLVLKYMAKAYRWGFEEGRYNSGENASPFMGEKDTLKKYLNTTNKKL